MCQPRPASPARCASDRCVKLDTANDMPFYLALVWTLQSTVKILNMRCTTISAISARYFELIYVGYEFDLVFIGKSSTRISQTNIFD